MTRYRDIAEHCLSSSGVRSWMTIAQITEIVKKAHIEENKKLLLFYAEYVIKRRWEEVGKKISELRGNLWVN